MILVLVVIAGYLVWLRSKVQTPVSPQIERQQEVTITPVPQVSEEATPPAVEATASMKEKVASPSPAKR